MPPCCYWGWRSELRVRRLHRLSQVQDGDTLSVLVYQRQVKIRLESIDAPESKQLFGGQSPNRWRSPAPLRQPGGGKPLDLLDLLGSGGRVALLVGIALLGVLPKHYYSLPYIGFALVAVPFVVVLFATFLLGVVQLLLLAFLVSINLVRFGLGTGIRGAGLLLMTAEPTPVGLWQVYLAPRTGTALSHSQTYDDPKITLMVVNYLRGAREVE